MNERIAAPNDASRKKRMFDITSMSGVRFRSTLTASPPSLPNMDLPPKGDLPAIGRALSRALPARRLVDQELVDELGGAELHLGDEAVLPAEDEHVDEDDHHGDGQAEERVVE